MGLWDRILGQLPRVGVLGMSWGLPIGLWDSKDTGTTAESLGCPGDSKWDFKTLGQLPSVGVLGMSQGLRMGLWDRQDTRPTPKVWESIGCLRDSLATQWDLG